MSRYQKQYEILKKGTCGKPKVITQEQLEKFKKSGLIRSFDVKELPQAVEPPPIEKTSTSMDLTQDEPKESTTKKTGRKKK